MVEAFVEGVIKLFSQREFTNEGKKVIRYQYHVQAESGGIIQINSSEDFSSYVDKSAVLRLRLTPRSGSGDGKGFWVTLVNVAAQDIE